MRFTFSNILLPDSNIDEPNSHGIIKFKISPVNNVPDFTQIYNMASIYFDQNDAVLTNWISSTLVIQIPNDIANDTEIKYLNTYPNPASDYIKFDFSDEKVYRLRIFDPTGKNMMSVNISNNQFVNIKNLASGIYYYQISEGEGMHSGKFIVEH